MIASMLTPFDTLRLPLSPHLHHLYLPPAPPPKKKPSTNIARLLPRPRPLPRPALHLRVRILGRLQEGSRAAAAAERGRGGEAQGADARGARRERQRRRSSSFRSSSFRSSSFLVVPQDDPLLRAGRGR